MDIFRCRLPLTLPSTPLPANLSDSDLPHHIPFPLPLTFTSPALIPPLHPHDLAQPLHNPLLPLPLLLLTQGFIPHPRHHNPLHPRTPRRPRLPHVIAEKHHFPRFHAHRFRDFDVTGACELGAGVGGVEVIWVEEGADVCRRWCW